MNQIENPQLQLAFDFVQFTNKNIFLTGKAGTGKTTFLHNLRKVTPKRMVVVAPTGVAAINAGGVTIHSFFQMPFSPYIPGSTISDAENKSRSFNNQKKMSKEKINLIKSLDLLVIDEISMVRADLLDGIDEVLKKYRDRSKPFGGVQLLMIGDLHQLSPVIKENEWNLLKDYYDTIYFFSSKALKNTQPVNIELKHIYRQEDARFIDILNQVRNNNISTETLKKLNERYIPDFNPNEKDGYIILTTHNATALEINHSKLKDIQKKSHTYSAVINNDFPEYAYPTEVELELKVGAQVMFVKNDTSWDKLFYNGKIGKIVDIGEDVIIVKCPGEYNDINVSRVEWENVKYSLDPVTKIIHENIAGSFVQFPLKLAWAITIHKSQGLTFEKAIIDANASFAHGQVYVALSRCKNFEGLVLRTPITLRSIKMDGTISEFTDDVQRNEPGSEKLTESKIDFQRSLLIELFDFKKIRYRFKQIQKLITENIKILDVTVIKELQLIEQSLETNLISVSDKFKLQMEMYFRQNSLPEENQELLERVKKASIYFTDKLTNDIQKKVIDLYIETDNKILKQTITDAIDFFQKDIFVKINGLQTGLNGFTTVSYIHAIANADIDYNAKAKQVSAPKIKIPKNVIHSDLYLELKNWRNELAEQNDMIEYLVLPQKTLLELVVKLPVTLAELRLINGIGKAKVSQFGEDIIDIIAKYCEKNNIKKEQNVLNIKPKKEKPDTKKISYDLYKEGKFVDQIAKVRKLTIVTVEGHLAHYIGTGDLNIYDFVLQNKVETIIEFFNINKTRSITTAKNELGNYASFSDLKFVMKYMEYLAAQN